MASTEDSDERTGRARVKLGPAARATVLLSVLTVAVTFLLWLPRPVAPTELPPLTLDRAAIEKVLAREAKSAAGLERSPLVRRVDELYREQGIAESGPGETAAAASRRRAMLGSALLELRTEEGEQRVRALRSKHVALLSPALEGELDDEETRAALGSFLRMLKRYELMTDTRMQAPSFVIRTLYKARWNAIFGLDFTDGFAPVERQAYYGWRALHGREDNPSARLDALEAFEKSGGARALVARGILLYRLGYYAESADVFDRAYAESGNLRFRNYQLAALHLASGPLD